MSLFLAAIANQVHSRAERSLCRVNEFFDEVVSRCSLCRDVCEAKIRAGLKCLECKDYVLQTNDPADGMDDNFVILPLALLAFATILVISAIIIMGIKLHKQKDRINRGKLLEKDVLDVEAGANVGSHSNEVQAEEIHQNDHSRAQKQKAVENIYM